jgi:hypothetical protein
MSRMLSVCKSDVCTRWHADVNSLGRNTTNNTSLLETTGKRTDCKKDCPPRNVAPCTLVEIDWRFRGSYCLRRQRILKLKQVLSVFTRLYGVTSQETFNFISDAVRSGRVVTKELLHHSAAELYGVWYLHCLLALQKQIWAASKSAWALMEDRSE